MIYRIRTGGLAGDSFLMLSPLGLSKKKPPPQTLLCVRWGSRSLLIFGNLLLRILYEQMMILFSIHENMNKITNQITGDNENQDSSASTDQFFDNMSDKIKQQQAKMQERREETARNQEQQYPESDDVQNPPLSEESQVKTVFCTKCGQPNKEDYKFCVKCGNPVDPQ